MSNKVYRIVLVIVCLSLAACATTTHIRLDREVKSKIKTVSVNESVPMEDRVTVFGMKQATAGVFGGAISAAVGEAAFDDKTIFKNILQKNDIRVGEILRSSFKERLEQANTFPKVVNNGADAQFNIVIRQYGLFKRGAFDGALRAAMWGGVSLVSADGKILWQKSIKPEAFEDRIPAYDLKYYQEHPEALRESFKVFSSIIVTELINDLSADSALNTDLAQQAAPGQLAPR